MEWRRARRSRLTQGFMPENSDGKICISGINGVRSLATRARRWRHARHVPREVPFFCLLG